MKIPSQSDHSEVKSKLSWPSSSSPWAKVLLSAFSAQDRAASSTFNSVARKEKSIVDFINGWFPCETVERKRLAVRMNSLSPLTRSCPKIEHGRRYVWITVTLAIPDVLPRQCCRHYQRRGACQGKKTIWRPWSSRCISLELLHGYVCLCGDLDIQLNVCCFYLWFCIGYTEPLEGDKCHFKSEWCSQHRPESEFLKALCGKTHTEALMLRLKNKHVTATVAVDQGNHVRYLFWQPDLSKDFTCRYHDVLVIDCTKKKNAYNLPLLHIVGFT